VKYRRTAQFKAAFDKLPSEIQQKVYKAFSLFQQNPHHPSLVVKQIRGLPGVWEGRIDIRYRFTFHYEEDICVFRNIGPHNILERNP
jgi:mRNA-degrading endonuclease RelE of RelBE toxin-antitoxin system